MAKNNKKMANTKNTYPSKTTINLYVKEDKTSRPSTIILYVLFIAVVLLGIAKVMVFDVLQELEEQKMAYEKYKNQLVKYQEVLERYDDVAKEYNLYSYSYLTKEEMFCDRVEILKMLEETVLEQAQVNAITVSGNKVTVNLEGLDLEKTAQLSQKIQEYDIVTQVTVNEASYGGDYSVRLEIVLTEEAGGVK